MSPTLNRRRFMQGTAAIGGISLAGLAGCIGDDDGEVVDPDISPDDYEPMLGILQPESGDLGDLGTPIADAAELPAILIERDTDWNVDVQREDSETVPEAGISAAESLVAGGYPMMTGAAASNVSLPIAEDVAGPNEMVMCSPASTSPDLTTANDNGFFFRTAPSDALQGAVMAEIAFEDRGWETASTLHLNDPYGQALSDVFVDTYEELGGEIFEAEAFEPEQPSYVSALESVLADEPDFLMLVAFPVSGVQIFRDFYSGWDDDYPVMITDGLIESGLPDDVDNPMDNVMGTAPAAEGPEADAFAQFYEEEYGTGPGVFNAHAFDASSVLLLANLRAGENTGATIRDMMFDIANPNGGDTFGPSSLDEAVEVASSGEPLTYEGASSIVEFDDEGDMTAVSYDVYEFGDWEINVVDTLDFEAE